MKNRNKKIRRITVNNIEYTWLVGDYNCDGDGGFNVTIYKNKKIIFNKVAHDEYITPKIIADIINELNI